MALVANQSRMLRAMALPYKTLVSLAATRAMPSKELMGQLSQQKKFDNVGESCRYNGIISHDDSHGHLLSSYT